MKCNRIAHFIGKNRKYVYPKIQSPFFWKGFRVGFCLLSIVLLLSCGKSPVRQQLERAEQVMETDSRAASAVLDSIDSSALRGEEAALYALFKTQADYKSYKPLTSDSLPLIATHYYGTKRKGYRAALSQYYLGCAYGDMQRDFDAIDALLRATTLFPDTTNKYFAYSLFELGKLYMNHHMEDAAIEQFKRYRHSDACKTDSLNIGYADYYMGLTASYKDDDTLSDSLMRCVIHNKQLSRSYHATAYHQLARLYFYHYHDVEKASEYTDSLIRINGKETSSIMLLEGDILLAKQEIPSAYENYLKASENIKDIYVRCSAYKGLSKTAPLLGLTDSIQSYVDHYSALLDTIFSASRQKEIAEIQDNHVVELHDKELEARHRRFLLWVGLFGVVVLTGAVITYLLADRRRKAERLRYENALDAIRQRQVEQLAHEEEEAPDVAGYTEEPDEETELSNADTESTSPFISLQRERIILYRKQFAKSEWPNFFHSHQADIKLEKKMELSRSEALMKYIDELFSELFVSMLNDNHELTKNDLEYCAMVMLGFKTNLMAYCTQATVHSYHCRHGRMKGVLSEEWYQIVFGKSKNRLN
ncbi:MAG: hypothetical protein IK000_09415 [Bacteroidaceae bacterium]|nr:hypothetical protein [Bacteroidaceae bacterium]